MYGVVKKESLADFGIRNITAYATEVNLDRAVPELYDGLKPVLRRVLWSAYHFKSGEAVKSAKIVGHCFAKGTLVIARFNNECKQVPIETLKIGDMVFTDGSDTINNGFRPITNTFVIHGQKLLHIECSHGKCVDCTTDQVFYKPDWSEIKACDLKTGQVIVGFEHDSRRYRMLTVMNVSELKGLHTVYDIEVKEQHKFFANGLLSHNCIGSYHPHGDASTYGAMQTLVHHNIPLMEGIGNWGGLLDPAASMRYTNAKLSKLGQASFDPNYTAVMDLVPNYDDTDKEPVVLPVQLPLLLLNGADGIGVGITSSIPTFTIESVLEVLTAIFSGQKLKAIDLARTLKPCLHWGGQLVKSKENKAQWLELMKTGRAKIQFQSTLEVDEKTKSITINDWHNINPEKLVQKVRTLPECQRAYNSKGATTFTIECKKAYNLEQFRQFVTKVQKLATSSVSYRFNCTHRTAQTVDGITTYHTEFLSLSVLEFFYRWARLRLELERKSLNWQIERQQKAIDYSNILIYASTKLEVVFKALKAKDSQAYLVKGLSITPEQANQILELKVRQLSRLDQAQLKEKLKDQKARMTELQGFLKRPKSKIKSEFKSIYDLILMDRKNNDKRKNQSLSVH